MDSDISDYNTELSDVDLNTFSNYICSNSPALDITQEKDIEKMVKPKVNEFF